MTGGTVGVGVGGSVGTGVDASIDGGSVGTTVGVGVDSTDGCSVGAGVGLNDGTSVVVGDKVVGGSVGVCEGSGVGGSVGGGVGAGTGGTVGVHVGDGLGENDGPGVGGSVGVGVGDGEGEAVPKWSGGNVGVGDEGAVGSSVGAARIQNIPLRRKHERVLGRCGAITGQCGASGHPRCRIFRTGWDVPTNAYDVTCIDTEMITYIPRFKHPSKYDLETATPRSAGPLVCRLATAWGTVSASGHPIPSPSANAHCRHPPLSAGPQLTSPLTSKRNDGMAHPQEAFELSLHRGYICKVVLLFGVVTVDQIL